MTTFIISSPIPWDLATKQPQSPLQKRDITVGVLALQGDFLEHMQTIERLGVASQEVRLPKDLETIDALILPGGESTTQAHLIDVFQMRQPLIQKITGGMPVWGTCAGMILLAKTLGQGAVRPRPLGVMDIAVNRNAFGRQIESFSEALSIKGLSAEPLHATFIRAPVITSVGSTVEVLTTLRNGHIVAAKEKNMLVTAFHPELTGDTRMHEYFLSLIL